MRPDINVLLLAGKISQASDVPEIRHAWKKKSKNENVKRSQVRKIKVRLIGGQNKHQIFNHGFGTFST